MDGPDSVTTSALEAMSGIRHGFFTRQGGVSAGLYQSLNCGRGTNDDPTAVAENRRRVAQAIGVTENRFLYPYQCHSATVVTVTGPWLEDRQPKVDALVTKTPGLALGILTADCVPLLFADPVARVIGSAHAGWKGAFAGVAEATLAAMTALGADRAHITAAIGPCIRQASYEVGADFAAVRQAEDPDSTQFFAPGQRSGHSQLNLPGYVALRLQKAGVGRIEDTGLDTLVDSQRFFSYRRMTLAQEADYGRQVSAIVIL